MAVVSRALLKTYFETGDFPTQAQCAALIDSFRHMTEDATMTVVEVPASSTAPGTAGTCAYDADYFYVCVATDTWRRVALNDWE